MCNRAEAMVENLTNRKIVQTFAIMKIFPQCVMAPGKSKYDNVELESRHHTILQQMLLLRIHVDICRLILCNKKVSQVSRLS